jgi:hypothetical protein
MSTTNVGATFRKRLTTIMVFILCFMAIAWPSFADTQWNVGISGGSQGINGFNLSVGDYYRVPVRDVVVMHERGIYEEELPVVFYLAQRAHVYPDMIVDMRLRGMSWMDITLYFGLSPEIYYVPVVVGPYYPSYGHAYGYYHNYPRGAWNRTHFRDRDIIDQVNLRFMSEHHSYAPEKIMKFRSEGRSFTDIDRYLSKNNHGRTLSQNRDDADRMAYRQNHNGQQMTRPNKQYRTMTRPDDNRQDRARQDQHVRNMTRPNQPTQTMTRADDSRQNMTRPEHQVRKMTRQKRQAGTMSTPDDNSQETTKQNQQPRKMTRRD